MTWCKRQHWREEHLIEKLSETDSYTKACPHCGKGTQLGLVEIVEKFPTDHRPGRGGVMVYHSFAVVCGHCGAWGGAYQTREHAIFMWNARTVPGYVRTR